MPQRLSKAALALALACSIGFHWAFFQSVAWVGMVISYSQHAPLAEALEKTFDGRHPCALCKQIAKGKQAEKKSQAAVQLEKFEFLTPATQFVFSAPGHFWRVSAPGVLLNSLSFPPPTPPPRALPSESV